MGEMFFFLIHWETTEISHNIRVMEKDTNTCRRVEVVRSCRGRLEVSTVKVEVKGNEERGKQWLLSG